MTQTRTITAVPARQTADQVGTNVSVALNVIECTDRDANKGPDAALKNVDRRYVIDRNDYRKMCSRTSTQVSEAVVRANDCSRRHGGDKSQDGNQHIENDLPHLKFPPKCRNGIVKTL
jgi:hypothetical protein